MCHQNLAGALLLAAGIVALQPSATIFNAAVVVLGFLAIGGAFFLFGAAGAGPSGSGGLRGGWRIRSSSGRSGLEVI